MKLKEIVELLNEPVISEMALKHFDKKVIELLKDGNVDSAVSTYIKNAEDNNEEVIGGKARPTITFKTIRDKIQNNKIDVSEDAFNKFEEKILEMHKGKLKPKKVAGEKAKKAEEEVSKDSEDFKEKAAELTTAKKKKANLIKQPKIEE